MWYGYFIRRIMNDVKLYAQITKVDEDKRIVEGFATTEAVDSQGEVVKLSAIKKALPEYMKYANLREMHQWSAVGKTIATRVDDKKKGLWIRGKIIDNNAWEKVKEKVYNGFSIGGVVNKKIGNIIHELALNEISLVDRPANPKAMFSMVKINQGGKVMEKQMPTAPYGMSDDAPKFAGIKIADRLLSMSSTLTMLIESCEEIGRPVKHIRGVLKAIKKAAMFELEHEKEAAKKKEEKKEKKIEEQVNELGEIVEHAIQNKQIMQPNWEKDYFQQLKDNL